MLPPSPLSPAVRALLRCPHCSSPLETMDERLCCTNPACAACYPVVNGIPILIDETRSVFTIASCLDPEATPLRHTSRLVRLADKVLPPLGKNLKAIANYRTLAEQLRRRGGQMRVLVVGAGNVGDGMAAIHGTPGLEVVETDVWVSPYTRIVCDGHDLPFASGSFDAVIIQAVLEHVVDPFRCVAEIHRVLGAGGLVYAETPFMQQVHMGRYDFTRFTHLGHRRLFRQFEEIESGATCGTGMALAWSIQYFMQSFTRSSGMRTLLGGLARLTLFWLPAVDHLLIDRPGTLDAASGYYFLGSRGETLLADRDLVAGYRGMQ